jgi:hypothetical protein
MNGDEFQDEMTDLIDKALERVRASHERLAFLPAFAQEFHDWDIRVMHRQAVMEHQLKLAQLVESMGDHPPKEVGHFHQATWRLAAHTIAKAIREAKVE